MWWNIYFYFSPTNPCFLLWNKPVNVYLWMKSNIFCDQTWFQATEKIIFDGMLERNGLNYKPMTDRMTQCASELNQIKSFIFKTIVVYILTCTLSYIFCMFFRCGSTWVGWYKTTVSDFTSELFYSWKILVVHCKLKAFDICCALCILR